MKKELSLPKFNNAELEPTNAVIMLYNGILKLQAVSLTVLFHSNLSPKVKYYPA